jgi:hypothetical protein
MPWFDDVMQLVTIACINKSPQSATRQLSHIRHGLTTHTHAALAAPACDAVIVAVEFRAP